MNKTSNKQDEHTRCDKQVGHVKDTCSKNATQSIDEHFDMDFFELINKFRIEEAIELLLEDKNGNLNIIDIAYEVGYNNKATFNKAFKKTISLKSTEFIDSVTNGSLIN